MPTTIERIWAGDLTAMGGRKDKRFIKLCVDSGGEAVGWAVLLDTQMSSHKQFGDMRVRTIVDCLARPWRETALISSVAEFLSDRGVDLIVSNQSHAAYRRALKQSGFMAGPSNFILAVSPKLASQFSEFDQCFQSFHFNHGDGDGPIHL